MPYTNRLRELREKVGLSRAALARLTAGVVNEAAIATIEQNPTRTIVVRQADALVAALKSRIPGLRRHDVFANGLLINDRSDERMARSGKRHAQSARSQPSGRTAKDEQRRKLGKHEVICPSCFLANSSSHTHCTECGASLVQQ